MTCFALDDSLLTDRRALDVDASALGALLLLSCYASANLTDGRIDRVVAELVIHAHASDAAGAIESLLLAGLILVDGDDIVISTELVRIPGSSGGLAGDDSRI